MRIFSLEATDMGNNQHEIADKCLEYVDGQDFSSLEEFEKLEHILIERACLSLGWASIPQVGGLVVNWEEK